MNIKTYTLGMMAAALFTVSCEKDEYVGKDPYADAREQLGIKLSTLQPNPGKGVVGTEVSLSGNGFLKYKDSIKIRFNGELATVVSVLDSVITVKVPAMASSGIITLSVGKDVVPGPSFTVAGAMSVDKDFQSFVGANNNISDITALSDGRFVLAGSFTDYNNAGLRAGYSGMVMIGADGVVDKSFRIAPGFNGNVARVIELKSGQLLASGVFSKLGAMKSSLGNITLLQKTGTVPGVQVEYTNENGDPAKDTVPAFNAYFDGPVTGLLEQEDGRVVVYGYFRHYLSKNYYPAGKDTVITDTIPAAGLVRIYPDGQLDKSFRYDAETHTVPSGVDGFISDAIIQPGGKIVIGGLFARYENKTVKSLIRLLPDGSLDEQFAAGSNLNGDISSIRQLPGNKLLVSGTFSQIGGKNRKKVAILQENGVADDGFDPGAGADGPVMLAERLGNGKILATGTFQKFNGVSRYGMAILDANGKLSTTHNNIGGFGFKEPYFSRPVFDILTTDQFNTILVGNFFKVDLLQNNRIVRLTY